MDYLDFYRLKDYPFSNFVDNRFYYNTKQHSEILLRLKYAVDTMKGLVVVLGDIGTGKTTLARRMLDELDEANYEAAMLVIIHSSITSEWLLRKIATQFGVKEPGESEIELLGSLYRRLLDIHESGRKAVVLVDEAQMLNSKKIMEEFRGLLNMETPEGKLITIIFFGLPELDEYIKLDEPLRQRIAFKCHLTSLDEDITRKYIEHRLRVAGCNDNIFEPEAINLIHHYSKGIPRLINIICDNALLEGFLLKEHVINVNIIKSIAIALGLNSEEEKGHPSVD